MQRLYVGTSGWAYKGWTGVFYPPGLGKSCELSHYAKLFNTVEINATFYRLPFESVVKDWYRRTPGSFIFAVKGSRYITHIKRLAVTKLSLLKFFNRVKHLKEKCGPILCQLPPDFDFKQLRRLDAFLKKLPPNLRQAIEFRNPSWYEHDKTFAVLREHQVAHVSISSSRMPMNLTATSNIVYIRLHGLEGGPHHDYNRSELWPWAEHCRRSLAEGRTVYAYFNNDLDARAPTNADLFRRLILTKRNQPNPRHPQQVAEPSLEN